MPKEQIAKKPKKRLGQYSRPGSENRLYGVPDTDKSDIYYGEVAKGKVDSKSFHKHFG
jgi:hypothetical protein